MNLDLCHQTQLYLGLYEREVYPWLTRFSKGINTAIDIGVGDGEYTLFFLAKTTAAKVFAFEPSEEARARFARNLELNKFSLNSRLSLLPSFVADIQREGMSTLDSLLPSVLNPCLVKMDIDGGEIKVLQGAKRFLAFSESRWIVETHSHQLEEDCIQMFRQNHFFTKVIPNAWWRCIIPELRPIPHNRWLVAYRP